MKKFLAGSMSVLMAASMSIGGAVPALASKTTTAASTSASDSGAEKVFRFAVSTEPTTLDQSKGNSVGDNEIQRALTEGLVREVKGEIQPGCAEKWEVSDDQLTYTFHLRDGLKWSDGQDIKASDFVYGFQRLVDPETSSPYGWVAGTAGILNADDCNSGAKPVTDLGIAAPDDKTVVITLANPTPYFLSLLGNITEFSPVRQDIVEKYGTDFAATADKNVYSGPFVLTSSENEVLVFEPNPNYWNPDAVHFTRVEESIITDSNTALAMYESGDLDFVNIPLEQVANYAGTDGEGSFENGNDDWVFINSGCETQPLLQDVNFRKALNYAVNHTEYISLATSDVYTAATTLVLPEVNGATEGKTYGEEYGDQLHAWPVDGDADQAKEYLQKAMDTAGITDPSSITLEFTTTDNENDKKIAEVLQQMWQETLGITVNISQVTYAEKNTTIMQQHQYEVAYGGWSPDYSDPYTYLELFRGDNPNNNSNYHSDDFDTKLASTVTETDPAKRMQTLADCENILLDDAAFVPLQFRTQHYLMNSKVSGINFTIGAVNFDWPFGDIAS